MDNQSPDTQLKNTPYLTYSDPDSIRRFNLVQNTSRELNIAALNAQSSIEKDAGAHFDDYNVAVRSELVAESNAIEGFDWTTTQVRREVFDRREILSYNLHNFLQALRNDKRVFEALGLYKAHMLADTWAGESQRPHESEIRSLHSLVAAGETYAGKYKSTSNSISGSDHQTIEPWDVPRAMHDLSEWWCNSHNDPILDATVVHAWLTHIHPFEDGNGRMARLLANLTLVQSHYPPLILNSQSDRQRYLDALAASDSGDILPLYDLFTSVIGRTIKRLSSTNYVHDIIHERFLTNKKDRYNFWTSKMSTFGNAISDLLIKYDHHAEVMGMPDIWSYSLLEQRDYSGNCWFMKVFDSSRKPKWLLWFGFTSDEFLTYPEGTDRVYPSIFFSVRDHNPTFIHPYRWLKNNEVIPDEIMLLPGETRSIVMRSGSSFKSFSLQHAAEFIASGLVKYSPEEQEI